MKSQEIITIDQDEGAMTPPPQKKMKQARLPFQVITPKAADKEPMPPVVLSKRRRLTDDADDIQVVKIVKNDTLELRIESKENVCELGDSKNEVVIEGKCPLVCKEEVGAACEKKSVSKESNDEDLILGSKERCLSDSKPNEENQDLPQSKKYVYDSNEVLDESGNESDDEEDMDLSADNLKDNQSTPKQNTSLLDVSGKNSSRKLTPRQQERMAGLEKAREEKQRLKQEKEDQKKKERELKEDQKRKEREEKEDQKKKEREEKEDQRKKEKEEKEKKKQSEIEVRNEEKRVKDEEKRKKDLAEETAKSKTARRFTSFFVPRKSDSNFVESVVPSTLEKKQNFMPFQIKADMRLAPLVRKDFTTKLAMDKKMKEQDASSLYLDQLKNRRISTSAKTWPLMDLKNEVVILEIDDKVVEPLNDNMILEPEPINSSLRVKLLQFHQNRRPPYWGTWRKKSTVIRPTTPFVKDSNLFDYAVDSDDEWEEEEPGESLHGTDDEKESVDDYEIDNEFFVPHGYLSEEEDKEEGNELMSPETQKAKLKFLELEFEEEMKHKTERIKPRLLGCFWASNYKNIAGTQLMKLLESRRAVHCNEPIEFPAKTTTFVPNSPGLNSSMGASLHTVPWTKKIKLPLEAIPALIKLVHGNTNSRVFLVKEFTVYWENRRETEPAVPQSPGVLAQKSISNKIKELAKWMLCPDEGPLCGRMCWYVSEELRSSHGLADLQVPNTWKYTLKPRRTNEKAAGEAGSGPSPVGTPKQPPLITNFTKTVTQEEKQKQFQVMATSSSLPATAATGPRKSLITNFTKVMSQEDKDKQLRKASSSGQTAGSGIKGSLVSTLVPRKRAPILFSVPRGQDIPKKSNSLTDQQNPSQSELLPATSELNQNLNGNEVEQKVSTSKCESMEVDSDVITID